MPKNNKKDPVVLDKPVTKSMAEKFQSRDVKRLRDLEYLQKMHEKECLKKQKDEETEWR